MDVVDDQEFSPHVDFTRDEWSRLRASTPLTLSEADLAALRGLNEPMPLSEVEDVYLAMSRLLNLRVAASRELHTVTITREGSSHVDAVGSEGGFVDQCGALIR